MEATKKYSNRSFRVRSSASSFIGHTTSRKSSIEAKPIVKTLKENNMKKNLKDKVYIKNNYLVDSKLRSRYKNNLVGKLNLQIKEISGNERNTRKLATKNLFHKPAKDSIQSPFKFKSSGGSDQHSMFFEDVKFQIIDKVELKTVISKVTACIQQLKTYYQDTISFKVLSFYQNVLQDVNFTSEKLNYLFFDSKYYIHNRSKLNIKRLLLISLFTDFKEIIEYDEGSYRKNVLKEENFDYQFFQILRKLKVLLKDKLKQLQEDKINVMKNKSEKIIDGLNSVINESIQKTSQINKYGFIKNSGPIYKPKGVGAFNKLGKLMKSEHYFGKPSFSPNAKFSNAWKHNKQFRVFLNDLSTNLRNRYHKIDNVVPKY